MLKIQKNLIYNIKFNRKKLKITQEKLAELCDVSANYIGRIEIGYHFPSAEILEKLSEVLNIQPHMLFVNPDNFSELDKNEVKIKKQIIVRDLMKEIENVVDKVIYNI